MSLLWIEQVAIQAKNYHLDLNVNQLWAFAIVCNQEGISASELMHHTGMSKATASRALRLLADKVDPAREGYQLIELQHDPKDYRVRRAYLTPLGHQFKQALIESTLEEGVAA
ncbi:MAG: hypothetical protein R3Y10_08265 [Ferrimonas sp.]